MTTFSVRVRRGPFSGIANDGVRLPIVPGIYQANQDGHKLVFAEADKRTGGGTSPLICATIPKSARFRTR